MSKLLLHLGSGACILPGFVNIDINPDFKPDVCMDYLKLSERYAENSATGIICIHSLEHCTFPDGAVKFFQETFRVLKSGGVLRVVVPDLEKAVRAYCTGSDLRFLYGQDFKGYYYKENSRAERLNYFIKEWEHKICYDFDLLLSLMVDAGFNNIARMPFGKSRMQELSNLDRMESESLCIECEALK